MKRAMNAIAAVAPMLLLGLVAMSPPSESDCKDGSSTQPTKARTAPQTVEMPTLADTKARDDRGLHNVVAFHETYLSGSVPEGDEGFDTLAVMGVKTIISVDGAVPDVALAKARGIRYIHLPIGYNGFDEKRKLELVRATRDAMNVGPVYIHCHHGRHRSAGAAAAVAASLGWLKPMQAVERMKVSGTAPNYKGLYKCATDATVLEAAAIDAVPADFPEISQPATFVKSMVEIDHINDHLKAIEKAGWTVPKDHPDLVPVAEAGRMADLFRLLLETEKVKSHPADFRDGIALNGAHAQTLEDMLLADHKDTRKISDQLRLIQNSCRECHATHRD